MATVVTPRGAVLRSSATASGPYARPLTAASASVVVRRRWTVPGDPASVLSFVQAHLPAGAKLFSTGGGGPPSYQSVTYSWPVVQGVLDVRWLYISAGSRRGGGTVLYAESQSQWVITRPRDEQIPAGVRQVDVTSGWPGRPPFLSRRVTDSAKVGKLVRLFDSLEIVQPIAISCPAFKAAPIVTVTFSTGTTGRVLARASVSADTNFSWPPSLPGWACIPISFSVRGQPRTPLVGNVIRPIHHLLHVRLDRG